MGNGHKRSGVDKGGSGATHLPTSDRTSREIDADPRRFSCRKKWNRLIGLQYLLPRFICTDATAGVLHVSLRFIRLLVFDWHGIGPHDRRGGDMSPPPPPGSASEC